MYASNCKHETITFIGGLSKVVEYQKLEKILPYKNNRVKQYEQIWQCLNDNVN